MQEMTSARLVGQKELEQQRVGEISTVWPCLCSFPELKQSSPWPQTVPAPVSRLQIEHDIASADLSSRKTLAFGTRDLALLGDFEFISCRLAEKII